jgi:hypothetical protein
MWGCIKNLIRIGKKTSDGTPNTAGVINTVNVDFLGKIQPASLFLPYGIQAKTSNTDSTALIFQQEGNEDSLIVILADIKNIDTITGNEGLNIGIPSKKERIKFKDTGKITFQIGGIDGGDFLARFNELKAGFDQLKADYNSFVTTIYNAHNHPTAPTGPVSTPSTTGTSSTASIDDAKIDEIEVPPS